MTDQTSDQGGDQGDAIAPDDPSVAHDPAPEGDEETGQAASDPTPDTSADAQAVRGEGGEEGQEGSPDATAPDPSGIEPGETQSVPTLRGPGPGDDSGDAQG